MFYTGKAHKFGDDINTDYIITSKYLTNTRDFKEVACHLMEDVDPEFYGRMSAGDFIVARENFGCGSSKEAAPWVIKEAGIGAVIAKSFARIFYRNAVNINLPVICADTDVFREGDILEIDLVKSEITVKNTGQVVPCQPMPEIMLDILREGGIVPYLKKNGGYVNL